ncbi:MAG TPA: fimbria/pilus outer membrane usher protein [Steroidobacteraceae bacterium]|jgi:outer membrane usher protein
MRRPLRPVPLLILLWSPPAFADGAALAGDAQGEALLEVSINGTTLGDWSVIHTDGEGAPRIRRDELDRWGIRLPNELLDARTDRSGYVSVAGLPGVQAHIDNAASRLDVVVQPSFLQAHDVDALGGGHSPPEQSPPGTFARYDITALHGAAGNGLGGLLETGAFRGPFFVSSTWLATPLSVGESGVRLDTAAVMDFPATQTSLRLGDGLSSADTDGTQVRLAGVSWGTDFSTTPAFIPFPLPSVRGESVVPGVVDLLLNGATVQQIPVPAGPFSLNHIPVPTGNGDLTVIVRDALGREQVVTQHYYAATELLNAGLTAWNVEAGAKRDDYGLVSNAYAGWIADGSWRHGFTNQLTGQIRVSADESIGTGAFSLVGLAPLAVVWNSSLACSAATASTGCRIGVGVQKELSYAGFGVDATHATSGFASIGDSVLTPAVRTRATAHLGVTLPNLVSLVAFATVQENMAGGRSRFLSLDASRTLGQFGHLDLLCSRQTGIVESRYISLQFTHRLGRQSSSSSRMSNDNGVAALAATISRSVPVGPGYGYEVSAQRGGVDTADARLVVNGEAETASLWLQQVAGHNLAEAELSGSVLWLGEEPFATRSLEQGFALVRVPGVDKMPVYRDGQLAGHTDANGVALITGLRPFERNEITIDPSALPLSLDVSSTSFSAVPFRRGGVVVEAKVHGGATIRLQRTDAGVIPAGAVVETAGGSTPVGLDGVAFVYGQSGENALLIRWEGGRCVANVKFPLPAGEDEPEVPCRPLL